jgi:hypothetical protein
VYLYDAIADGGAGGLSCVSCVPDDPQAGLGSDAELSSVAIGQLIRSSELSSPLSFDGRFVFFDTADRLLPADKNDARDVYEYDTTDGSLHLLSSGAPGSLGSFFVNASPSGSDVFFVTRDRLVGWDTDQQADLYDARVGGGLPEPPATPIPCGGDVCHGPVGSGAALGAPLSSSFVGVGNVKPVKHHEERTPRRCRRGFVRKRVRGRVRCVRVRARHAKRAVARKGR